MMNMKKIGISGVIICLILAQIGGVAGQNDPPEIEDDIHDIQGPLINVLPYMFVQDIDVVSAWFSENEQQPDYLYVSIQVNKMRLSVLPTIISVNWSCNGVGYSVMYGSFLSGLLTGSFLINEATRLTTSVFSEVDRDQQIRTFVVPKDLMGSPQPGDVVTDTAAWGLKTMPVRISIIGWEDAAPNEGYGSDYIIQY